MPPLQTILGHLDDILRPQDFRDFCPNGLQVPGATEIETVVTGVSANGALLDRAAELEADLVLVHHGLFWKGDPLGIPPLLHRRLKVLYAHDIALAAYHLPLDGHPTVGNNALLADALHLTDRRPLKDIGVSGALPEPLTGTELALQLAHALEDRIPLHLNFGPAQITRVGLVSGAAGDYVFDAIDDGCEAFVTGEPAERSNSIAQDLGVHFYAAGHHATERSGVKALGELLAREFGVRHEFVDIDNPI